MAKLFLTSVVASTAMAEQPQKADVSVKCFMDLILSAKEAIPIGLDAAKLAASCEDDPPVCVSSVIGLLDHLGSLEVDIAGAVGDCGHASPACIKAVQGVGQNIHNIASTINGFKSMCVLHPTQCLPKIKAILPEIENIPETIQHASRGCAGRTSYDWCDCGKGTQWIDVWDPSNPSDRHRISVGGWAPIKWQKPVSEISWVCDGMGDNQKANLPSSQAWRMSFTVQSKQCGFSHKNSGRIEWDSAGVDSDGVNATSIVV